MASTPSSSPLSQQSQNTVMTTPPATPPNTLDTYNNNDTSDIWASDSPPPPLPQSTHPASTSNQTCQHASQPLLPQAELSDLPSLRRQHMTTGYREGLSIGKARVIQGAFDKGYPLGVELGLRVGEVLGMLEGFVGALKVDVKGGGGVVRDEGTGERRKKLKEMERVLERARSELDVKALLAGVGEGSVADAEGIDRLDSVEETVRQWEREVLGRWAQGDTVKLVEGEAATDIERIGHPGHAKEVG